MPLLLHHSALAIYVLVIFLFNIIVGQLGLSSVSAAVDASTLYSLHNSNRSANGLNELTINQQLVTSATNKAQAMLSSDCWDHYCPPGTSPWSFILNTGYEYIYAGENLGEGFTNSSTLMNAWMNSPSHRANVLGPNFTEIGIGFAYGEFQGNSNNVIVVVHFGSKEKSSPPPTVKPVTQITANKVNPTTKPSATAVPAASRPTAIPGVVISSPADGSLISNAEPDITGTKPNLSKLDILINDNLIGKVETNGESFSFRPAALEDGEQRVKAVSYINNRKVSESNEVKFTVDTTAPEMDPEKLEVTYNSSAGNEIVDIRLETSDDTTKVSTNILEEGFSKQDKQYWLLSLTKEQIKRDVTVIITAEDKAGNQTILELPSNEILGYFDHTLYLTREIDENDIQTRVSGSLLSSINTGGIRSQVNFIFILFLFALFSLDFYLIHKSGLTGVKKSKSHLQLSAFVILIMVMLLGGFGGHII